MFEEPLRLGSGSGMCSLCDSHSFSLNGFMSRSSRPHIIMRPLTASPTSFVVGRIQHPSPLPPPYSFSLPKAYLSIPPRLNMDCAIPLLLTIHTCIHTVTSSLSELSVIVCSPTLPFAVTLLLISIPGALMIHPKTVTIEPCPIRHNACSFCIDR